MQSTPENRLRAEWHSGACFGMSERSWQLLADLGITMEHQLRTGYLGFARINFNVLTYVPHRRGMWAFIMPVFDPGPPALCDEAGIDDWELINLAAFLPLKPERFYLRLNEDCQTNALEPAPYHETPYNWIMADGEGSCHVRQAAIDMREAIGNG